MLQALLEMYNIPYCGCGVLSSALGMDKAMCKQMCQTKAIPQLPFILLSGCYEEDKKSCEEFFIQYEAPLFLKPANSGSSIGISKLTALDDFEAVYTLALQHDDKLILEKGLVAPREIEIGIVGNRELIISAP